MLKEGEERASAVHAHCTYTPDVLAANSYLSLFTCSLCPQAIHAVLAADITPMVESGRRMALSYPPPSGARGVSQHEAYLASMERRMNLAWVTRKPIGAKVAVHRTPAQEAARGGHVNAVQVLGGFDATATAALFSEITAHPEMLDTHYSRFFLQGGAAMLGLDTKQKWLQQRLKTVVRMAHIRHNGQAPAPLDVIVCRGNILAGLIDEFGIDTETGENKPLLGIDGSSHPESLPWPVEIRFEDENAAGDGLRREWLSLVTRELMDPATGLFVSRDRNRTLQPNPHSATTAGDDHLAYFALLGRVAGLALYYREPLPAAWPKAFIKAALGYAIEAEDLREVDPMLHEKKVRG